MKLGIIFRVLPSIIFFSLLRQRHLQEEMVHSGHSSREVGYPSCRQELTRLVTLHLKSGISRRRMLCSVSILLTIFHAL